MGRAMLARCGLATVVYLAACLAAQVVRAQAGDGGATWQPGEPAPVWTPGPAPEGERATGALPPPTYDEEALPAPAYAGPPQPTAEPGADTAANERRLTMSAHAGFGFGQHGFWQPTDSGGRNLPAGSFAAYAAGLRVRVERDGLSPGLRVQYRSSTGYTLREPQPGLLAQEAPARVHELTADLELSQPLAGGPRPLSLLLGIGYLFEDLRTERTLRTAPYGLSGPHLRPGLRWPASERLIFTLAADAAWLSAMDTPALATGLDGGYALAAELVLEFRLLGHLWLRLDYREAHSSLAMADPALGERFSDTRRFAVAGMEVSY